MIKYLNKIFPEIPIQLQIILFCLFVIVGCEGFGLYAIGAAGNATGSFITKQMMDKQTEEGQIYQLKDGRWITNKGIILKDDDPRVPHLKIQDIAP